jgi:hypothetical protein
MTCIEAPCQPTSAPNRCPSAATLKQRDDGASEDVKRYLENPHRLSQYFIPVAADGRGGLGRQ